MVNKMRFDKATVSVEWFSRITLINKIANKINIWQKKFPKSHQVQANFLHSALMILHFLVNSLIPNKHIYQNIVSPEDLMQFFF